MQQTLGGENSASFVSSITLKRFAVHVSLIQWESNGNVSFLCKKSIFLYLVFSLCHRTFKNIELVKRENQISHGDPGIGKLMTNYLK